MTHTKHTPGPWKYVYTNEGNDCFHEWYLIEGPKFITIADTPSIREENEANARLIAAAPDMLHALKLAANHLEACAAGHIVDPTMSYSRPFVLGAIAKAEGTNG